MSLQMAWLGMTNQIDKRPFGYWAGCLSLEQPVNVRLCRLHPLKLSSVYKIPRLQRCMLRAGANPNNRDLLLPVSYVKKTHFIDAWGLLINPRFTSGENDLFKDNSLRELAHSIGNLDTRALLYCLEIRWSRCCKGQHNVTFVRDSINEVIHEKRVLFLTDWVPP